MQPNLVSLREALDPHPQFPEVVAVNVPRGYRARLSARAASEGTTRAALLRRTLDGLLSEPLKPVAA